MYPLQKEHAEAAKEELPAGKEFESLLKRLSGSVVEEKVKIAIAGRYFATGKEAEYERVIETVQPRSVEERTLKNNQDILVLLVRYNKEQKIDYLKKSKELIAKTHIFPTVKTMFLLATEAPQEEILKESYKLDRNCKHSAKIKAISFIGAKKYSEASSLIERLSASTEKTMLQLIVSVFQGLPAKKEIYNRLIEEINKKQRKLDKTSTQAEEKEEMEKLDKYTEYAKRLMNEGPGIGYDLIISEIDSALKNTTGVALGSANHLMEKTTKNPSEAIKMLQVSKKLFLEVEILRAEALLGKKRYMEANELAQTLKKDHHATMDGSAAERIAIILISSSLHLNKMEGMDISWIVNALSPREQKKKDVGLSDFVELIKNKEPGMASFDHTVLAWTKKMIKLSKNTNLIWRPKIESSKYFNRLGNIYFAHKDPERAKKAYEQAIATGTESQIEDTRENMQKLEEWMARKDLPIKECPEAMCLFKSLGNTTENPSAMDYITGTTSHETAMETAEMLEEIANALIKDKNTVEEARIINILSLCSLVKFKKQILTPLEISESNISVIYNHIVFWIREKKEIDMGAVQEAIKWYTSKHSTPSQTAVAKCAIMLTLKHLAKSGRVKRFNEVFVQVEEHIKKDPKDRKEIDELRAALEEINTPVNEAANAHEEPKKETVAKEEPIKIKQEESEELLSKREEVMRMLTEGPEKKQPKKTKKTKSTEDKERPVKKQKASRDKDLSEEEPIKPEEEEKPQPVPIKRVSHTILSSDEEDE